MRGKDKAFLFRAFGVQLFQVERHRFEGRAHPLFDFFELRAADLGKGGRLLAHIAGKDVHLLDGHVQDVAAAVFEGDVFLGAVRRLYLFGARDSPHTVRFVHGVVAHLGGCEQVVALAADALFDRRFRV